MNDHWKSGDPIILRAVPRAGRVGAVIPVTVVQDGSDLSVLYVAPGTVCKRRTGRRGGPRGRLLVEDAGGHEDWEWKDNRRLILYRPPAMHSVSLFWRDADDAFLGWYIDVLVPFRRMSLGFDTRDLELDVVIDPDRTWHWKDEDELAWSQEHGRLAPYDALSIRREAERAIALLEAGDPLFDASWIAWRPDPAWSIPGFPDGWQHVGMPRAVGS